MSLPASVLAAFDVERVRADFPALHQQVNGKRLAFLDSAASSQTPQHVLKAMDVFYERDRANIHRGVYSMSERATKAYEGARDAIAEYVNAAEPAEIIFTRGTTESINLVANAWGGINVGAGDEIVVTVLEHHSNIVPWQLLAERAGATVKVVPCSDIGELDFKSFVDLLSDRTRIVALGHVSNALGTINPVEDIIAAAHRQGIPVLLDGAQALPHMRVDLQALDVDFYAFSGHKMYGPTGIGVLYGKREHLDAMPPWQGGGDMIRSVSFAGSAWAKPPARFEAGTPNIAGGVGLGATVEYLTNLDLEAAARHEAALGSEAANRLESIDGVRLVGTAPLKVGVVSFVMDDVHPHDIGTVCDQHGVAIRTGHHCAQPLMERLGVPATARASFAAYNTREDIDQLIEAVTAARELFA